MARADPRSSDPASSTLAARTVGRCGVAMPARRRVRSLLLVILLIAAGGARVEGAVVCARPRTNGTFDAPLKIREACRAHEVQIGVLQLEPLVVGPQSSSTASTSISSTTTGTGLGTTTTSTPPGGPVCGNGIIEAGEACDCAGGPGACAPYRTSAGSSIRAAARRRSTPASSSAPPIAALCLPTPVCGDGIYEPGDTCDYGYGTPNDQCLGTSRCTLTNPCRCFR